MPKGPHCRDCTLEHLGTGFASGIKGNPALPLGVLLVAESLGEVEAAKSDYLVGPVGQFMDRLIARTLHPTTGAPLSRMQFGLENTEHCQPPGDAVWGDGWGGKHVAIAALDHCRPYLEESLRRQPPRAIMTMGVAALRFFTGRTELDGKRVSNAGYIHDTPWGPVIANYHPSYLLRGKMHYAQKWQTYLARAVQVAERGVQRIPLNYDLFPTVAQAWAAYREYEAAGFPPLGFDMETPYSREKDEESKDESEEDLEVLAEGLELTDPSYRILRDSFSWAPGRSITMPHTPEFRPIIIAFLSSPGIKVGWNVLGYDIPRYVVDGIEVLGDIWDGMLFFGRLKPGLPKKLASVAADYTDLPEWKSESASNPEFYSAVDPDAALRCTLRIVEGLKAKGMWEVAQRHITRLFHVLRRASRRGVNVDRVARKASRKDFEGRVVKETAALQQYVPQEVRKTKIFSARPSVFLKAAEKKRAAYLKAVEDGTVEEGAEGWDLTDGTWIKVQVEVALKPGWEVGPDGEEFKPKPPKKERKKRVGEAKARNRRKPKLPRDGEDQGSLAFVEGQPEDVGGPVGGSEGS